MIHIFSKALDRTQINESVTDKQLLSAVNGIEHFKYHLLGKRIILEAYHHGLKYLQQTTQPNSCMMRWSLFLQDFDFEARYIAGEFNSACFCSRHSVASVKSVSKLRSGNKESISNDYHLTSGHGFKQLMNFLLRKKFN